MKEPAMCASIVEAMLQVVGTANCVENYERRDACNRSILRIVVASSVIISKSFWWSSANITGVIDSLGIVDSTIFKEESWH